jgi:small conductance mechanosensitive channel
MDFARDPDMGEHLLEPPSVLGVVSLGDSAANMRITLKTKPGKQWDLSRALRKHLLAACEREGISLPYRRQEVLLRHLEGPASTGSEAEGRGSAAGRGP